MNDFILGFGVGFCTFGLIATYGEVRWRLLTRINNKLIGRKNGR